MTVQYSVTNNTTALVAATAKTIIELNTTANVPAELVALDVSSNYLTVATPISLLIELGTATATGTGTGYTAKRFGQAVGVAATTSKINDTVEGAGYAQVLSWTLILPGGPFPYQWPLGREYFLSTSTFNVVRLTASAACNVTVNATIEE